MTTNSMNNAEIQKLRLEIEAAIKLLAKEFKELIESAKMEKENPMVASTKKLSLDLHTMRIDQAARSLLQNIRKIKEMKICDNWYQPQRDEFELQCQSAAEGVQECIKDCYSQLTALSSEGFEIIQNASKLIR